jgi:hypothetical protein
VGLTASESGDFGRNTKQAFQPFTIMRLQAIEGNWADRQPQTVVFDFLLASNPRVTEQPSSSAFNTTNLG